MPGSLLGIAQLKAGHKDDAMKTFKAVKGDPALERLANLWGLHAKQANGTRRQSIPEAQRAAGSNRAGARAPAEPSKETQYGHQGRRAHARGQVQDA